MICSFAKVKMLLQGQRYFIFPARMLAIISPCLVRTAAFFKKTRKYGIDI